MEWPQGGQRGGCDPHPFRRDRRGPENFRHPVEALMKDPAWCEAVGLVGGPFCYTDAQRDMPF